jgi:hypothetical protein
MYDIPNSWVGRINIVKMTILLEATGMFNEIPIQISMTFFKKMGKSILNSHRNAKDLE